MSEILDRWNVLFEHEQLMILVLGVIIAGYLVLAFWPRGRRL